MKSIVATFAFTVVALAAASTSYVCHYGVRTIPAQTVELGGVPPPCGVPGFPPCPMGTTVRIARNR